MLRLALVLSLATALLVQLGGVAGAHTCPSACGNGGRLCSTLARQVYYACRLDCVATFAADPAGRRTCVSDCRSVQSVDRAVCNAERTDCAAGCAAAADDFCAGEVCGLAYNQCLKSVRADTRDCIDAAATPAAMEACVEPGDSGQNIGRAALEDCRINAVDGLDVCVAGC